ncbi:MAG: TRAP transporter large permease [Aquisalimonadaceae bacterium]
MAEESILLLLTLFAGLLFVFGSPILVIMSIWVLGAHLIYDFPLQSIGSSLFEGLNSFSLLAAPLFILTGDLIAGGGIARRMTNFSLAVLGWLRGGLGMAAIMTCGMFAAISGSNSATTATIGSITYPHMREQKYGESFSAATSAAGGVVGIIIPPSILFIIYGYLTSTPVSELFLAGVIPGILMTIVMLIACFIVSRRRQYGQIERFSLGNVARRTPGVSIAVLAATIVLWGIYSGAFSPTEAAAVTVMYCLFMGVCVTRELKLRSLHKVILRSGIIVGIIMPLVAISLLMQQMFAVIGVGQMISQFVGGLGGYYIVLFTCMAMVLISGTLLESIPNTVIMAPILAPVAIAAGVDPFHFAVVFMVGGAIGFITPPFGLNLYVAAGITGVSYLKIARAVGPYLVALLLIWVVIALVPQLAVYLTQFAGR